MASANEERLRIIRQRVLAQDEMDRRVAFEARKQQEFLKKFYEDLKNKENEK